MKLFLTLEKNGLDAGVHFRVLLSPPQEIASFIYLKALCFAIVDIKREDLVKDYVESFEQKYENIQDDNAEKRYQCNDCFLRIPTKLIRHSESLEKICPKCGTTLQILPNYVRREVTQIKSFNEKKFVPSIFKLIREENLFSGSPAEAWAMLTDIEWYSKTENRDYFRKKLTFSTAKECTRSIKLLELNSMRLEVRAIKKNESQKIVTLKREKIDDALSIITNKLYEKSDINKPQKDFGPEAIELEIASSGVNIFKKNDLRLIVSWPGGITEVCHMHSFHSDTESKYIFFDQLINNPGVSASLNDGTGHTNQYLREAGIDEILWDIFVLESNKNGATLKSNRFILSDQPTTTKKKLSRTIKKLKHLNWRTA